MAIKFCDLEFGHEGMCSYNDRKNNQIQWSRLEKQFVPDWFISLLSEIECAVVVSDSDSVMWRFESNHMGITFDKLLMYTNNVLQYRTYYYEGEV